MPFTQSGLPWAPQSDSSHDAAVRAGSFHLSQQARVLAWFQAQGGRGGTQIECSAELGIARASICPRVNELEKAGRVTKLAGTTRAGAAVYVAGSSR